MLDGAGTRVYGGGPPPEVPGVTVMGLAALAEELKGSDSARGVDAENLII